MPSLRFDLISEIIALGKASRPDLSTDPSLSPLLRSSGVGMVTAHIEQLSLIGLVDQPMPIFGQDGGMWIAYRVTEQARRVSQLEADLRIAVGALIGGPRSEVATAVAELEAELGTAPLNPAYRADFVRTLEEIRLCFDHECYIATIALCGKVLEVCLKHRLLNAGIEFDPNSMIGRLLSLLRERLPNEYHDPSLSSVANIINVSRITAVHAREQIPIPSRDQTIMVIFATRDVARRTFL
jgi:hypothetical protein